MSPLLQRILSGLRISWSWWTGPVSAVPLRVFELTFAGSYLVKVGTNMWCWREWLTDWGVRPTAAEYQAMGYMTPLPAMDVPQVLLFSALHLAAGLALLCNWQRRSALFVFFLLSIVTQAIDPISAVALHKIYVAHFFFLWLLPGPRRSDGGQWVVPRETPYALRASLVTIYFASALAKSIQGDWLTGSDVLWSQVQGFYRSEVASIILRSLPLWTWGVMQHSALAFELLAPAWFSLGRTRPFAVAFGLMMHIGIAILLKGLIYFSLQMCCFYALWISADQWRGFGHWIERAFRRLRGWQLGMGS